MRSISSAFVCRLLTETPAFFLSFIYDDKNWLSQHSVLFISSVRHTPQCKKLIYLVCLHIIGALSSSFQMKLKWAAANQSFAVIVTMAKPANDSFSRCFISSTPIRLWTEHFRFVSCRSLWDAPSTFFFGGSSHFSFLSPNVSEFIGRRPNEV